MIACERVVGRFGGEAAGPALIVTAGLHGNEPAGVAAARRVLAHLAEHRPALRGELTVLAGNLGALRGRVRYVERDLNRQWTPERIAELRARAELPAAGEEREQRELFEALREAVGRARGPLYLIDLHTSSGEGPPFLTVGDTLRNRRFALTFPLPILLGLEEQVDGALLEYLGNLGVVTLGVEGGQSASERSVDHHEAVLWQSLVSAGLLQADAVPDLAAKRRLLERSAATAARLVEVRYRHAITPAEEFRMLPGFTSFHSVRRGELLGHDRRGMVRAPEDGMVLLPLYQGLGEDGFFIGREVRPFWLGVSLVLRRLRLAGLMPFLPGVRRHPQRRDVLIVDTRIARAYPLEIFHLLGFRKLRREGSDLVVSRRSYDLAPPRRIVL